MKNIISKIFISLLILFTVAGCKSDDLDYPNPDITPVEDLYAPVEGQLLTLKADNNAYVLFQWAPSHAQDAQLVSYEVVFFETADSSTPIYRMTSDNVGKENYARVNHIDINRICAIAGIPVGETGNIYWSVTSWRGIKSATCSKKSSLVVTRLDGFEVVPENVYIVGSATEVGDNITNALTMKKVEEGEFEIYTELDNAGEFYFIDRKTDNPEKSYINTSGNLTEVKNGETSTVSSKSIYRIKINFLTRGTEITKIKGMELWHCWEQQVLFSCTYNGLGIWTGTQSNLRANNNNTDSRYKIRMAVEDKDGNTSNWWWGPVNSGEDADPSGNPAYYYMATYYSPINQWDPKWKFNPSPLPWGKTVTMKISLVGDSPYTHSIEY